MRPSARTLDRSDLHAAAVGSLAAREAVVVMTDRNTNWDTPSGEQPGRPNRWVLVTGVAAAVVVLATVGAVGGWVLAGGSGGDPTSDAGGPTAATSEPSPTSSATSIQPATPKPTGESSRPSVPDGQLVVPSLVGKDFEQARKELRERGLGWQLIFGIAQAGNGRAVVSTQPPARTPVRRGVTVKVSVLGEAPEATVPDLTGLTCGDAADRLVDAGFYPEYPSGKVGRVAKQDPEPQTTKRWNDQVRLYCGSAPSGLPGSPSP
jgi:hypothetical protein